MSTNRLQRVKELWKQHEPVRTELANLLFEEREERKSKGGRGVHEGFHEWLKEACIPKSSAYRMIVEHEITIGLREEKPVPTETSLQTDSRTDAPMSPVDSLSPQSTANPAASPESVSTKASVRTQAPKTEEWLAGHKAGFAEAMHKVAAVRFKAAPLKCYQRHIRELYAEIEGREQIAALNSATVVPISNAEAEELIVKYEWLQTMGAGTVACYGLKLNGELLGVACFGKGGSPEARSIVTGHEEQTICLMRGTCVPHAPRDASSFLVRHACRLAHKEHGWTVFFAYSDEAAGEIGTVYQAVGWHYAGTPNARKHVDFVKDSSVISSYQFNRKSDHILESIGWSKESGKTKYEFLRGHGWQEVPCIPKKKWVWFEGPSKGELKEACRYDFQPYPKRPEYVATIPNILPRLGTDPSNTACTVGIGTN